jgi:hypothetical protein
MPLPAAERDQAAQTGGGAEAPPYSVRPKGEA